MTILVEFTVAAERFELGAFVADYPRLSVELERVVPVDKHAIPFIWATGPAASLNGLTETFERSEKISEVDVLDTFEHRESSTYEQLYRIEWIIEELDIVRGIVTADGAILEGSAERSQWFLRFRSPAHQNVTQFYQFLTDNDFREFTIESIREMTSPPENDDEFGLTDAQHQTLLLAARRGYFDSPRAVTLEEIAEDLGITKQAVSQRLRRATEKVVLSALDIPDPDV